MLSFTQPPPKITEQEITLHLVKKRPIVPFAEAVNMLKQEIQADDKNQLKTIQQIDKMVISIVKNHQYLKKNLSRLDNGKEFLIPYLEQIFNAITRTGYTILFFDNQELENVNDDKIEVLATENNSKAGKLFIKESECPYIEQNGRIVQISKVYLGIK